MQVCVLGPLTIESAGRPVEIGGARLRSLLARLAADAGSWVSVSRLVEALWPDDAPADEVNALQSLVSRLRRALPRPGLVESGPAGYRLVIARSDVDALAFEHLIGQGRRAASAEQTAAVLGEALNLWRGAPLTEVADAPYAEAWIERLERLRLTAIDERAAALISLGRPGETTAELEELSVQQPLRERTHELLIRALAADGRQGEALAAYERLRRAMADELGLDPPAALQELQSQVLRDDAGLRAPAAEPGPEPAPRRTNLRVPLTSFVGRDTEVEGITGQVSRARLVTLVGTGGAGKTRLVSEVASRLTGHDGVWMVELAPVMNPEDVASTVLGSIGTLDRSQLEAGLPQHPTVRDVRTRLIESLAPHDAVIVLDNCEHLIEACAELAAFLLARCPRLIVLATSREPLGIVGESIWPVRPLAVQSGDAPAVKLFTDRAALVRPGFTLTPENTAVVTEICRRLDGLPLAIELAAARLRTLGPEALASRLDNRFRLLTGGNRTAMPRHQTLRAVVAWSWELLTEAERDLIERLSVFPGGATAATAAAVCTAATQDDPGAEKLDLDEDSLADLLISLADKSLLVVATADAAEPRYRLLETIREYALERLAERGEMATMRGAHARYFLTLAETADPHLRGPEQLTWLARITAERDNLLASLRFGVETEDADHAVRLAAALGWFWTMTSRHEEAGGWAEQALRVPGESPPGPKLFALVLSTLASSFGKEQMPTPDQVTVIEEQYARVPDVLSEHPLLSFVEPALIAFREGMAAGRAVAERFLEHPDPWGRAAIMLMVAVLADNEGDFSVTEELIPKSLAAFEELGDRWGIGTASSQMAEIRRSRGDLDGAVELLERARRMMIELLVTDDEAQALVRIAQLRMEQDDLPGARRDLETAQRIAVETGSRMALTFVTTGLAAVTAAEGDLPEACRLIERTLADTQSMQQTVPQFRAMAWAELAGYEAEAGDLEAALGHLGQAVTIGVQSTDMPVLSRVTVRLARYVYLTGDPALSALLLGAAACIRGHDGLNEPATRKVAEPIRAALTADRFLAAFEKGKALGREGAIALLNQITEGAAAPVTGPTASSI